MTPLEALQRSAKGETVPGFRMQLPPPIAKTLGFDLVSVEKGSAVFRLDGKMNVHANPMGTMHGGVLCDISDAAMGVACVTLIAEGESFTTLELKINFLRPVRDGMLEARAKAVHAGRTLVYLECEIFSMPAEKLVAKVNSTCLILRGEQAAGR